MAPPRDPDDLLTVTFKHMAFPNEPKSLLAGRPVFDDVEVCEIRAPGSKDVKVFRATDISRWVDDPYTGSQTKQSYAERFKYQYQQFKRDVGQTKSGTPLDLVPFLSEARRAELRAQNIYTVEQLEAIEGAELKNLGPGGREMKNKAAEFMTEAKSSAPNKQMEAELAALKARNAVLEEDLVVKRENARRIENEFEEMTLDQLRDYIETHTGQPPLGNLNKKTLVRMATECRPSKAA